MNTIRILLVEPALDEARFLIDALEEIQESAQPDNWMALEVTHVQELEDAHAIAVAGAYDVVLLNPELAGTNPYGAFITLRDAAPDKPVILLLGHDDPALAQRLLRDGAQDCLVRNEIDCGPLARAIGNALDRQRHINAFRRGSSMDNLTGFYNEWGFHNAGTRELHIAAGAGQPLLLVLAEIDNLTEIASIYGQEQREITLLDAADIFRDSAGCSALLGCLARNRFAALLWNTRPDDFISAVQDRVSSQVRPFAFSFGWAATHPGALESLDPLLTAAEAALCENGQSYPLAADPSHSTRHTASAPAYPA